MAGAPEPEQTSFDDVPDERVERFLAFYRREVEAMQGEPLPRFSSQARKAARELLRAHPDGEEVAAVLRFGLADHRWYATKILTVPKFRAEYPKLRIKWLGAERGKAMAREIAARRPDAQRPDGPAPDVSYDGDRIVVTA